MRRAAPGPSRALGRPRRSARARGRCSTPRHHLTPPAPGAGQRIPAIENLSATQDQFDAIDLSNNDLKKLESATILRRLKMLLLSNNKLSRVADAIGDAFPQLEALVLSNNDFAKLSELDNLVSLRALRSLSLVDNDVAKLPEYRQYMLHLLPGLRTLDFQKVKQTVRASTLRAA